MFQCDSQVVLYTTTSFLPHFFTCRGESGNKAKVNLHVLGHYYTCTTYTACHPAALVPNCMCFAHVCSLLCSEPCTRSGVLWTHAVDSEVIVQQQTKLDTFTLCKFCVPLGEPGKYMGRQNSPLFTRHSQC